MATLNVSNSDMQSPGIPASGVAEDMAAIFGSAKKVDAPPFAQTVKQAKSSRRHTPLVGVLVVAGLATMLTAGVLTGQNAVNESAEPITLQHEKTATPRAVPQSEVTVARPSALKSKALEPVSTVTGPAVRTFARPFTPARLTPPIERTKSEGDPIVALKSEPIAVRSNQAAASIVPVRALNCNDGSDCLQSRLYTADRDLLSAYNDAASAGVNVRDLRAYRSEWLRARSLVDDRPREALRIYGMIASDLRLFTDEASGTADGDLR
jgi:hypothetical protein